jgi:hypothetical protein
MLIKNFEEWKREYRQDKNKVWYIFYLSNDEKVYINDYEQYYNEFKDYILLRELRIR